MLAFWISLLSSRLKTQLIVNCVQNVSMLACDAARVKSARIMFCCTPTVAGIQRC